jgi:equilibrative nucleoside transporter 1/2/3
MAVVKYETKTNRKIAGVASGWLCSVKPDTTVPVWWKKGTMPFTTDKPMILVGPGTGVAAFRSAILHAFAVNQSKHKIVLIFGCRDE